jgi:hypothetical protein
MFSAVLHRLGCTKHSKMNSKHEGLAKLSMNWQMASRTATLSSTTRIHGVRGDGMVQETTSVAYLKQYEFRER